MLYAELLVSIINLSASQHSLLSTMVQTGHAVAVAFALNIAAGAATILGGMVVFNKRLVYLANPLSLAVALSISTGVMLFISLAEIFGESVDSLSQGIKTDDMSEDTAVGHGWLAAACCTAIGIGLIYLIDVVVKMISPEHDHTEIDNLENLQESMAFHDSKENQTIGTPVVELESQLSPNTNTGMYFKMDDTAKKNLQRMGLLSALAIGIHNVPEGIATYAGSIQNSSVGFSLAFGIGLHNIPEGIAVAAPIYFATGSRWRGIMWCVISAVAEPLGGVIAWLAIGDGMDHVSEGILFGLVCGIMVCICVKELLPTAFRFAGDKAHLVAMGIFFGMFIMITTFALNIAAGFATVLGGMVIFHKSLVHLANPVSLAVALSISAGVMLFISLVEIYGESVHLLTEGLKTEDMSEETATGHGWLGATACFAVGIFLIYGIDIIVHKISPEHEMTEIDNLEGIRESMEQFDHSKNNDIPSLDLETQTPNATPYVKMDPQAKQALQRMGVLSALAIGIHNLPEGIATYVGAIQNSSVGFSLAVGIGLHNIPEGIAVAAPIYFATGSRWRGIMWCAISAGAEPLGGVIAWLAIGDGMDPVSEGILFGIVCGIMVCICVKELIPTAYKFAKGKTHIVAFGMFTGMFIMVSSLTLFGYAGV
ncbi:Zinc transporter ZupT [Phytophthora citrophthora]|uniref:Zinc transporter ZupT n=1 Tax=Phytophthora citrophthora TaxID=4793 RepID=A0AAD9G293_9STRA|nr:Zinc transporter ZupT [Phytophthora citrophthora]